MTVQRILRIDASARYTGSFSRALADRAIAQLQQKYPDAEIVVRDLAAGVPLLTEEMVVGYNTPDAERTAAQQEALQVSNALIEELKAADILVFGIPIYNFSVPGALKAYIDLICRARLTFSYSSEGPVGLLADRKTYLIVTSGGTPIGSEIDFATGYLQHVLKFIGISDVEVIEADKLMQGGEAKVAAARQQIATLVGASS